MSVIVPKECLECSHFTGPKAKGKDVVITCKAFPKEIPGSIIINGNHYTVRKGQVGDYIFERIK